MSRSCTLLAAVTLLAACGSAGCTADITPGPSQSPQPSVTASPMQTETPGGTVAPSPPSGDASGGSFLAYSGAAWHAGSSAYSSSLSGTATFAAVGCVAGGQVLHRVDAPQPAVEGSPKLTILREGSAVSLTFKTASGASGPAYKATSGADGRIAGLTVTRHSGRWNVALVHVKVSDPDATTGVETVTLDGNLNCPAP